MIKLYIDDIRTPKESDFMIVRSFDDAIFYMEASGCPEYISFDHDLGEAILKTGFDIAKWMVEQDLNSCGKFIPKDFEYHVHSANPVGAANINGLLDNYLMVRAIQNITNGT